MENDNQNPNHAHHVATPCIIIAESYCVQSLPMRKLESLGFRIVGNWVLEDEQPKFDFGESLNKADEGFIYAFFHKGNLKYIGQTERLLKARMVNIRGNKSPEDRRRKLIRDALKGERNGRIHIYAIHHKKLPYCHRLPIWKENIFFDSVRKSWESILISDLQPPWNKRGKSP